MNCILQADSRQIQAQPFKPFNRSEVSLQSISYRRRRRRRHLVRDATCLRYLPQLQQIEKAASWISRVFTPPLYIFLSTYHDCWTPLSRIFFFFLLRKLLLRCLFFELQEWNSSGVEKFPDVTVPTLNLHIEDLTRKILPLNNGYIYIYIGIRGATTAAIPL